MATYTDITMLLDRSGSMASIKNDMEGAFNEFIKEHQKTPSTRLTLIQFDGQNDHDVVYEDTPITEVKHLHLEPRGWTPLIDAFVKAIDCTGSRLSRMKESDRPDQVLFVIITDGEENTSKKYHRVDVEKRVKHQNEHYKWQFVYLGANQDAIKEAATYGIDHKHALTWGANSIGTRNSMRSLTVNTANYVNANRSESNYAQAVQASLAFDDEQRKKADK